MTIEQMPVAAVEVADDTVVMRMTAEAAADLAKVLSVAGVEVWTPVIVELRAAKAEIVDRVDVARVIEFTWHPCPAQCGRRIRTGHIMCPACWTRVPDEIRHKVWAALHEWRAAEPARAGAAEAAFHAAREEALESALGDLVPEVQEPPC